MAGQSVKLKADHIRLINKYHLSDTLKVTRLGDFDIDGDNVIRGRSVNRALFDLPDGQKAELPVIFIHYLLENSQETDWQNGEFGKLDEVERPASVIFGLLGDSNDPDDCASHDKGVEDFQKALQAFFDADFDACIAEHEKRKRGDSGESQTATAFYRSQKGFS